jgi:hypothetical protein
MKFILNPLYLIIFEIRCGHILTNFYYEWILKIILE